jgi:hypothetical protein
LELLSSERNTAILQLKEVILVTVAHLYLIVLGRRVLTRNVPLHVVCQRFSAWLDLVLGLRSVDWCVFLVDALWLLVLLSCHWHSLHPLRQHRLLRLLRLVLLLLDRCRLHAESELARQLSILHIELIKGVSARRRLLIRALRKLPLHCVLLLLLAAAGLYHFVPTST